MTPPHTEVTAPGPDQSVAIAYIHQDDVTYSFHHSMTQLMDHDLANNTRIWSGGYVTVRCGTGDLAAARNRAVKDFLAESRADWLWWVDTDMGFAPDIVDRLFDAADPVERPVVAALTFAYREVDNDGMGGRRALPAPVIMYWTRHNDETGFDTRWDYPADSVIRCDGVGSAAVLIHRSVFERVRDFQPAADKPPTGPNWYTRIRNGSTGEMISEDLSLCCRLMALGIPVHVHTGVKTTHAKRIWIAEEDYWKHRAISDPPPSVEPPDTATQLARAGFDPESVQAAIVAGDLSLLKHTGALKVQLDPPAAKSSERTWTVPRYAIIPTYNRPARLLSLVVSLGAQCDGIVILDNASNPPVDVTKLQAAVPDRCRIKVISDDEKPPNLARFWNIMFERIADEARAVGYTWWDVAVLNDDAVVPAGWYDACATGIHEHPTAVIAHTNPTRPALLTELHNDPNNRMTPHAFVIRGEAGMRADESMKWWYQDTDLDWRARQAGGVLSVPGPRVVNAHATETTRGALAEQAQRDREAFLAKWDPK